MFSNVIQILEYSLYGALAVFIVSTLYLINTVKKENLKLVKSAVTNPIFPNLNLSFFSQLRDEYHRVRKSNLLISLNKISFYMLIFGVMLLFVLVISQELFRY